MFFRATKQGRWCLRARDATKRASSSEALPLSMWFRWATPMFRFRSGANWSRMCSSATESAPPERPISTRSPRASIRHLLTVSATVITSGCCFVCFSMRIDLYRIDACDNRSGFLMQIFLFEEPPIVNGKLMPTGNLKKNRLNPVETFLRMFIFIVWLC